MRPHDLTARLRGVIAIAPAPFIPDDPTRPGRSPAQENS
jgi:hypothetical protein